MTGMTRRTLMAWTLAEAAAGTVAARAAAQRKFFDGPSLDALARAKGLGFGSCLGTRPGLNASMEGTHANSFDDPGVRALTAMECGIMVPENELKWYALRPDAHTFDFARADTLTAYAARNHLAMRGHTLLWNYEKWMQPWVKNYDFGDHSAAKAEKMLREHVAKVCGHFGKRIFSYDVINESFDPKTGELQSTVFTRALGPRVFDVMFEAAHEAAPHAQLVYNDYMTWTEGNEKHYAGVLRMLERMRKKNVPIDALGIQSHIGTKMRGDRVFPRLNETGWRKFLDEVTGMGLDLIITELDVQDRLLPGDVTVRDKAVADYARGYLDLMLSYSQLRYVMVWGLADAYSWLRNSGPRADGLPKRPCPYDDALKPKPFREAIASAFRSAPSRPATKFG